MFLDNGELRLLQAGLPERCLAIACLTWLWPLQLHEIYSNYQWLVLINMLLCLEQLATCLSAFARTNHEANSGLVCRRLITLNPFFQSKRKRKACSGPDWSAPREPEMHKKVVKLFSWNQTWKWSRLPIDTDVSNKARKSESHGIPVVFSHFQETRFAFLSALMKLFLHSKHQQIRVI